MSSLKPTALVPPSSSPKGQTDDVAIQHYIPPPLSFMSAQRKGVRDPCSTAKSYQDHLAQALEQPFPMAADCPLPDDIREAIKFTSRSSNRTLTNFWDAQLSALSTLVEHPECSSEPWYALRPKELSAAPKELNIALLAQLASFTGIGALNWLSGYIYGFPITGTISQSKTFPLTQKPDNPKPLSLTELWEGAADRFRLRSKRPPKMADTLWTEALQQVDMGWLDQPRLLNADGRFADAPDQPVVNAFRFPVIQGEKIRACDDLKASLTNRACSVLSPITLPTWEHIAQISSELALSRRAIALGKADESDAYKKQPLSPSDATSAVITLYGPDKKWYGFISRSQIFGSTASVIHYNTFSRLLVSLFVRLFGIPMVGFFDDFGFVIFADVMDQALSAFINFCRLLGVHLSAKKCAVGTTITFLGLKGSFPSPSNRFTLRIALDPEKATKWSSLIESFISAQSIDSNSLDKLLGRLSFATTNIFGKFARAMAKPLYDLRHSPNFVEPLNDELTLNLKWWLSALVGDLSRSVGTRPVYPRYIIYTDASWKPSTQKGRIAAILIERQSGRLIEVLSSEAPLRVVKYFDRSSAIYGLELFALVAAFATWQDRLAGRQVSAFVDNDPSSNGLIRGAAKFLIAHNFILRFWQLCGHRSISVWFERVPSPVNLADLPTRDRSLPFPVDHMREFPLIDTLINFFLANWDFGVNSLQDFA